MSTILLRSDEVEYQRRTRWSMTASTVAHALIMLWIVLLPVVVPSRPALTEITLIEPGELSAGPAAAAAPAAVARERTGTVVRHTADQSFRRAAVPADLAPEPESPTALADRLTARLAATHESQPVPISTGSSSALSDVWSTPAAAGTAPGGSGPALALTRGGSGASGPSLALNRGGGAGTAPAIVPTGLPAETSTPAPARGNDTVARRVAAGAMLAGPIADRPVVAYTRPVYPEWAKRDAVEGSVTLYFHVRPDGGVQENVLVQKTAGFEDFDENARAALRAWRFAPLGGGRTGEQWGTITFHYRLREAG